MDLNFLPEITEVDHIVPVNVDRTLAYTLSNLQTLCRECHWAKTAKERGISAERQKWIQLVQSMLD